MDFSIYESPAVKALGPLFKLTEVHLWDDGSSEVRESAYFQERVKLIDGNKDYEKIGLARFNGFSSIPEDVELAKELNDLGLPLSFHTNKETRHGLTSGKRKSTRKKNQESHTELDCYTSTDSIKASKEEENRLPARLIDTSKMLDQCEILKDGIIVADIDGLSNLSLEREDSVSSTACTSLEFDHSPPCTNLRLDGENSEGSCLINEEELDTLLVINHETEGQSNYISLEVIQDSEVAAAYEQLSEEANSNMINNNHQSASSGEWIAYWDDFYTRTYFYNVETGESTWDPPSGMEHLVCGKIGDGQTDMVNGLETSTSTIKRKKKVRRTKSNRKLLSISSEDLLGVVQEVPPSISKYWCQRYLLFSRFDYGIKMDEQGWFSVTPEPLAKHHAVRCGNGAIVDFFTGVGGNAIQFARRSKHVIAIDIDPNKIDYARHNAAIYGVDDNIDFIKGDSFSLAPKLKANTVFMSPPWGGPDYSKVKKFDINTMLKPRDGQFLFDAGKRIAPKIVMFLPRNVDVNQLAELSLSATPSWSLEVEMNYLNGRLKAVTAYFSEASM